MGSDDVLTLEVSIADHIDTDKCKDMSDYAAMYRDIDGLHILVNDQITHKVIPQKKAKKEEAKEDAQKKKKKAEPNPLIYPGMGPGPDHFKPPDQGNGFGGGGF